MAEISHDREVWRELIDLGALEAWMDTQGLESGPIRDAGTLGGGTQNILLQFTRGDRRFVLRRPPRRPRAESDSVMRREMKVLAALAGTDVPHPSFIAGCADPSIMGIAFYLMEPVDGFNATEGMPDYHAQNPKVRRRMSDAIVDGIVALSRVDTDAVGLSDFGKIDHWLERQVPRWRRQLDAYAQFDNWTGYDALPDIEAICRWLEANRPSEMRPGLIHGDYHLANVMYDPSSPALAAIVDWELASLGDPLLDLGWLTATWYDPQDVGLDPPVMPWDGFAPIGDVVDRYLSATGRSEHDALWFSVLAPFKLGAILEGSHARACAGLMPRAIGDQLHESAIFVFNRALRRISQEKL